MCIGKAMSLDHQNKSSENDKIDNGGSASADLILQFFNLSPDAIIITEMKSGTILEANQAFEKLYGGSSDFVRGKTVFNLGLFRLEIGRDKFLDALQKKGKAIDLDGTLKTFTGKRLRVSVSSSIGKVRNIDFIFSIIRDIADRHEHVEYIEFENKTLNLQVAEKEFEKELLENAAHESVALLDQVAISNDDLETLNKQKDKFFSIIAHDLKSPFQAILGFSSMLKDNVFSMEKEAIVEYAGYIHKSAENSYAILNDLLDWAMSQMGKVAYNPLAYKVSEAFKKLDEIYSPLAEIKDIKLSWVVDEELQSVSDRKMVETVIRNLVNNAIKFTGKNGQITTEVKKLDKGIEVSITDNGVGMTSKQIEGLFKLLNNASTQGTEGELGTGLGLSLCQEFVSKHGGEIIVTSEVGKGSCFTFTIPDQKF
jgi:PAS domain S-box-containing protein